MEGKEGKMLVTYSEILTNVKVLRTTTQDEKVYERIEIIISGVERTMRYEGDRRKIEH